jgi:hypothetical protein
MTRLRKHLSLGNLLALPPASAGYRGTLVEQLQRVKADGYESVQSWDGWRSIQEADLRASGIARLQYPEQATVIAQAHADAGLEFTNLHVGTGFENDDQMDALADSILQASARTGHRMLVETHRATATQDIWRTLRWIERFPELRFTADLSHWYTGHELTYGGEFEQRMAHLQPVFERTRAIHGRIGNSGAMQTPLDRPGDYVAHYRAMWTAVCRGFLHTADAEETLPFCPELLPMAVGDPPFWLHYAQSTSAADDDLWQGEPSDRYADAERLWQLACACYDEACTQHEQAAQGHPERT